jgi:hypothetical protein
VIALGESLLSFVVSWEPLYFTNIYMTNDDMLSNNETAVSTGGNLSNNRVNANSNNDIDPDGNITIINICSCFCIR